jgi:hypothetical protein
MANILRNALVMPTPPRGRIGSPDVFPNLLISTLALAAVALPIGQQLFASAPQAKYQTQVDISPNTLLRGIPQPFPFNQFIQESSKPRYAVTVDQYPNTILRGIPQPFPLITPDTQAVKQKWNVELDQYPNTVLRGIPQPFPFNQFIQESAKPRWNVELDQYPNLLLGPLALAGAALPPGYRTDFAEFQPKYAVQVDLTPNTILRGIPQPIPFNLFTWEETKPKYGTTVDQYPNLLLSTLALAQPAQPPGYRTDFAEFQAKYNIELDTYPNTLLLGISTTSPLPPGQQTEFPEFQAKFQVVDFNSLWANDIIYRLPPLPPQPSISLTRPGERVVLLSKKVSETKPVTVDFLSRIPVSDGIRAASCSCSVYTGLDPAAASMVSGPAAISGTKVTQLLSAGVAGVLYQLKVQVTTYSFNTIIISGYFIVKADA